MSDATTLPVADVKWRGDLYPRIEHDPATVQKYAADLDVLPPIEVNQHSEIIDGWHRWMAYRKNEVADIPVTVTPTASDAEFLELAISRNAAHGLQLSQDDKQAMARRIYHGTADRDRDATKKRLAKMLSVSERTVRDWLSAIDKDAKAARDKRIFGLWLACHTQDEIAAEVDCDKATVNRVCCEMADLPKCNKPAADHAVDFETPIYNVWSWAKKAEGIEHYGNSDSRILDNLLYLYTKPFDVVIDPFAGGGSTIDVCRKRYRRFLVSDRLPIVEREHEIRKHDLTEGLLKPPQWQDVRLVYLDPPYWKQAEGKYSNDPTDLANMPLDEFHKTLAKIVKDYAAKLKTGAKIALLIQPTQWNAPGHTFTHHVADMHKRIDLPVEMEVSCPYSTQQCLPQMVEWAKAERTLLVINRSLTVWSVQ